MLHKISLLNNTVQEYDWGSKTAIQGLLGQPRSFGRPMAELWMGAHPKAPSLVLIQGEWVPLNAAIAASPEIVLGKAVAKKFSNELPFLFKVLAADSPLSIQAHPNRKQALAGFERENRLGIPLTAPHRNYRDAQHKPEILCALIPFDGLKGFRPVPEILDLMEKIASASLAHELDALRQAPTPLGLRRFITALVSMEKSRQGAVVKEAARLAEKYIQQDPAFQWIGHLHGQYAPDIGVLFPAILNLITLSPGEAIFLRAGELHAYLHGVGIELMANSDNVLRGGLTRKHVDAQELIKMVDFSMTSGEPTVQPVNGVAGERLYIAPVEEFLLATISVAQREPFTSQRDRGVEILICTDGHAAIKDLADGNLISLTKGQCVLVPAVVPQYEIEGHARFYRASVPES